MAMSNRRRNLQHSCIKELEACVDYVQQYSKHKNRQFSVLKEITKEYCEMDIHNSKTDKAWEETDRYFDNQENDCTEDVGKIYNDYLSRQTENDDYTKHPIWCRITNVIEGIQSQSQEDCSEETEEEFFAEDDNASIDEGIISSQFEPPVDPLTKKTIQTPCRNKHCGHVYEYQVIMEYLKSKQKANVRCPYIGCTNKSMKSNAIVKDNALKQQISDYLANMSNVELENDLSNANVII